jgi:hypothetical protein
MRRIYVGDLHTSETGQAASQSNLGRRKRRVAEVGFSNDELANFERTHLGNANVSGIEACVQRSTESDGGAVTPLRGELAPSWVFLDVLVASVEVEVT